MYLVVRKIPEVNPTTLGKFAFDMDDVDSLIKALLLDEERAHWVASYFGDGHSYCVYDCRNIIELSNLANQSGFVVCSVIRLRMTINGKTRRNKRTSGMFYPLIRIFNVNE